MPGRKAAVTFKRRSSRINETRGMDSDVATI
jgi:hypothetical protein